MQWPSVITNHPDDAVLTEEDFKSRIVGSVMLPYNRYAETLSGT
ncbi:nudix hydrolase [Escherichia coli]|nr:nudix hydrolase [Escherichia coli]